MIKQQIDNILNAFSHPPCTVEDEIYYMGGDLKGYSIGVEDREYEYETLVGTRKETAPHYIVYREYVEYNYPHEPDYVDVAEVSSHMTIASAITDILHRNLDDKIDNYYESVNDFEAEQYYAQLM